MKKIIALKSIAAAALGVFAAAGTARAQVAGQSAAMRLPLGASAAPAVSATPQVLPAPAFSATSLVPLSAAPQSGAPAAEAPQAVSAVQVAAEPIREDIDSASAKSEADSRFDGCASVSAFEGAPVSAAVDGAKPSIPSGALKPSSPRGSQEVDPALAAAVKAKAAVIARIREEIAKVIVGQADMVESIVMSMIAGEHVLLEGMPGVAKTQAVKTFADAVQGDFKRIQGTPDKLPSDIVGAEILQDDPAHPGAKVVVLDKGPVFTNILLVDEINRMPPKTQAALLEAMAEGRVTVGKKTLELPQPFLVLATQNPIEQEGTYHLPEAQQDRFMYKVNVPRPEMSELKEIMERFASRENQPKAGRVTSLEELVEIRRLAESLRVDDSVRRYIISLVEATHNPGAYGVQLPAGTIEKEGGASPRAAIFLLKAARIHALLEGRAWVGPADVRAVAHRILRHRIILGFSAPRGLTTEKIIDSILEKVRVP